MDDHQTLSVTFLGSLNLIAPFKGSLGLKIEKPLDISI
jgi:hypothetical protein